MHTAKHVEYWKIGGHEDMAAARTLLEKGHYRHALFMAQLSVEKLPKAHVARHTGKPPPKIHNLARLAERGQVNVPDEMRRFLNTFDAFQLAGRYPDMLGIALDREAAARKLAAAEELLTWLTSQLAT